MPQGSRGVPPCPEAPRPTKPCQRASGFAAAAPLTGRKGPGPRGTRQSAATRHEPGQRPPISARSHPYLQPFLNNIHGMKQRLGYRARHHAAAWKDCISAGCLAGLDRDARGPFPPTRPALCPSSCWPRAREGWGSARRRAISARAIARGGPCIFRTRQSGCPRTAQWSGRWHQSLRT